MSKKIKKSDFISVGQIAVNRRAGFDYAIEETFVAGIELKGCEVKSLRLGKASLVDTYGSFDNGELFVENLRIEEYLNKGYEKHDPNRKKKLLLKRHEINKIIGSMTKKVILWLLKDCFLMNMAKLKLMLELVKVRSFTIKEKVLKKGIFLVH